MQCDVIVLYLVIANMVSLLAICWTDGTAEFFFAPTIIFVLISIMLSYM